jgi:hypothetical protein
MVEQIEDLLSQHAELLAQGQADGARALAAGVTADPAIGTLLTLADRIQVTLRPVAPNPVFRAALDEGLRLAAVARRPRRVWRSWRLASLRRSSVWATGLRLAIPAVRRSWGQSRLLQLRVVGQRGARLARRWPASSGIGRRHPVLHVGHSALAAIISVALVLWLHRAA